MKVWTRVDQDHKDLGGPGLCNQVDAVRLGPLVHSHTCVLAGHESVCVCKEGRLWPCIHQRSLLPGNPVECTWGTEALIS